MKRIPKNSLELVRPSIPAFLIGKVVSLELENDSIKSKVNRFTFEVLTLPETWNKDQEYYNLQLETNSDFPMHLWHWGKVENYNPNWPPNLDEFDYVFYFNHVLAFRYSQNQKTRFLNLLKAKKPIIIECIDGQKFIIKKTKT